VPFVVVAVDLDRARFGWPTLVRGRSSPRGAFLSIITEIMGYLLLPRQLELVGLVPDLANYFE
jgi:hypothetical protein